MPRLQTSDLMSYPRAPVSGLILSGCTQHKKLN